MTVTGVGFLCDFRYFDRVITSLKVNDVEYLAKGFTPNFWRGPTDNDHGNGMQKRLAYMERSRKAAESHTV